MIAHALIDVGSGTVGYLLLRDESSPDAPAAIAPDRNVRAAS
jgi:hypothetical protein